MRLCALVPLNDELLFVLYLWAVTQTCACIVTLLKHISRQTKILTPQKNQFRGNIILNLIQYSAKRATAEF